MWNYWNVSSKNNIDIFQYILNGLKQLQNRGYDSAGISFSYNDCFETIKFALPIKIIIKKIEINKSKYLQNKNKINIGIGHTRWVTHGAKTDYNSHPHLSYDNKVILVHNGIIENYYILKKELMEKNIKFISETDSEVIANLISYYYQTGITFIEAIQISLNRLEGTWGLVIINTDIPNKLYCVRRGSPLLISKNEDFVMISSEQSGFHGKVSNYFILEGNDLCEISIDADDIKVETNSKYILKDTINENFDLTPYPYQYWTIKEIEEQYDASIRALSFGGRLLNDNRVKLGGLEGHTEILKRIDKNIFLACGTSFNAALIGCNYFKELCNFNYVRYGWINFLNIPKWVVLLNILTQSGETKIS